VPNEVRYDGRTADALARTLALPHVALHELTSSTMDDAHALAAAGGPAGVLVLADQQTAGRGRGGRRWASASGDGIWMTLVERPNDPDALAVLSLRLGLRAARVLDRYTESSVRLKWPNDLYVDGGKLAGILVEARWRDQRLDWVAIGFGLNVRVPTAFPGAAALLPGTSRLDVLEELVPALRAATAVRGSLSSRELAEFEARDLARGRICREPALGTVRGISTDGELVIATQDGERAFRGGSLVLEGIPS
jgi:BirA family biotin operon repressor/biotin-[acetyl-CoA-carboxylase] ligase